MTAGPKLTDHTVLGRNWDDYIERKFGNINLTTGVEVIATTETVMDTLFDRFGIQPSVDYVAQTAHGQLDFERVCAFLVQLSQEVAPHIQAAALDVITALTSTTQASLPVPQGATDLCQPHITYANAKVLITPAYCSVAGSQGSLSTRYIVSSNVPDVQWQLLIEDATTACQVLRLGLGPTVLEVTEHLVDRGMPFKTVHRYT